jgi:hypothetical protein
VNIEIHQPELEALLLQRLESGRFQSVEDILLKALQSLDSTEHQPSDKSKQNLAEFLLCSPLPGSGLDLERAEDYPRPVDL